MDCPKSERRDAFSPGEANRRGKVELWRQIEESRFGVSRNRCQRSAPPCDASAQSLSWIASSLIIQCLGYLIWQSSSAMSLMRLKLSSSRICKAALLRAKDQFLASSQGTPCFTSNIISRKPACLISFPLRSSRCLHH